MKRKLASERGQEICRKWGQLVQPVFGQIKDGRGCDQFMRRGRSACASEWKLICTTHNLLKLWRHGAVSAARDVRQNLTTACKAPAAVPAWRRTP